MESDLIQWGNKSWKLQTRIILNEHELIRTKRDICFKDLNLRMGRQLLQKNLQYLFGSIFKEVFKILSQKQIIFDYFPDFWNLHNNEIFELKWETCVSKSKCFDPFGFDLCVCALGMILIFFCSEADGAFHPLNIFSTKKSDMLPVK